MHAPVGVDEGHAQFTHSSVPSVNTWCFQTGSFSLVRSTSAWHAANASPRCAVATAATMAKVAYPSMKRFGYSDSLATGAVAAGGTLGLIIPPSNMMVIYGLMTETSIAKLFAAGILPGLLATLLLCGAVVFVTWRDPAAGPRGERLYSAVPPRARPLLDLWPWW